MIKLKNKLFFDPIFMNAIGIMVANRGEIKDESGKVIGYGLSGKEKYDIRKIHKAINNQIDEYNKIVNEMRLEHGGLYDEKTNKWTFEDKKLEKELLIKIEEFREVEFEINRPPLEYNEIICNPMNAMEFGCFEEWKIMDFSLMELSLTEQIIKLQKQITELQIQIDKQTEPKKKGKNVGNSKRVS